MSSTPTTPPSQKGLATGALGTKEVVFQAISHLGPAIGVIIVAPVIASLVGASMPLLMLIAMIAVLLTGACVAMLAAKLPSAGGYFSFVSHGLGRKAGFVTAWAYFLYDPLIPTLLIMITAGILQSAIADGTGVNIPWWIIAVVLLVGVYLATVRGVRVSARLTMVLGLIECVVMVGFAIVLMVHTGSAALTLHPFAWPSTGGDFQPIVLAFAFGVLLFTGFESAAPLAEETAEPRKSIPRTIMASIVVVGLIWVLVGYSAVVAWPGDPAKMGTGDNPFFVLADKLSGWAWILLAFALLNSALAGSLAGQNAGARVLFALGRARLLSAKLGRIHPRTGTPVVALTVIFVLNLAVSLGLGFWLGPVDAFSFIGLFITLGVIVLYVMGNLSVIRLYLTTFRGEFNPLKHLLIPLVASAILVVGLYFSVIPWPAWPLNLAVAIVICWLAAGVVVAAVFSRSRAAALESAAEIIFDGVEGEPSSPATIVEGAL